jgi:exosome complex component CSL4
LAIPEIGAMIIGRIEAIIEPIAIVSVHKINGKDKKRYMISGENFILRASNIKKGYVKNVRDEFNIGDIIRARICEVRNNEFRITTEDDDCGCIKAFASAQKGRCELIKSPSGLTCKNNAEIKENRKIASDYRSMNARRCE